MSDPVESNEYLEADFEPQTLRVAELRRIFFEHSIDFKSTAKKAELIQIFNEQIKPFAANILRAKTDPSPSKIKIETVGNASPAIAKLSKSPIKTPGKRTTKARKHSHLEEDEEDDESDILGSTKLPPPLTTRSVSGRPRKVLKTEDEELKPLRSSPVKRTPARRKTINHVVDEEMTDEQSTPVPKSTKRKISQPVQETDEAFSSDNPFQSGSPQPMTSPLKRRETIAPKASQALAPPLARESRRKTEGSMVPQSLSSPAGSSDIDITFAKTPIGVRTPRSPVRQSERFMPAISQLKASPAFQSAAQRKKENHLASNQLARSPRQNDVSAGEEFTAEEQSLLPPSRRRIVRKRKEASTLTQALKWLSLLGLTVGSAYAGNWYRAEKIRAGYCGIDSEPIVAHPGATGTHDLINQIRPQCESCPPHAICSPGFAMICEDEFQKVHSPLSFGGMIPITPRCVPDTEKLRRIQVIADEVVETLRDRTASVECGYIAAPKDGNIGMTETELNSKLMAKKSAAISTDEFNTLFDHAMEDVKSRDEIEISSSKRVIQDTRSSTNTNSRTPGGSGRDDTETLDLHVESYYHSTSLANISVACSIRHTFYTILARYRVELIGLLTLGLLTYLLKNFFTSRNAFRLKTHALSTRVYDELATIKSKSVDNPERYEPHLGVSQLRDAILADEFSYSTREKLWHGVQEIVEKNSNVRTTQAEIQGEWLRAWEWVGAVREITREEKRRELGLEEGDEFVRPVV